MSNKKAMICIEEPIYNLITIHKKIDVVEAALLDNIEYLNRGKGFFKKNETIANELGVSVPTVSRKLKKLSELDYIEIKKVSPTNRKINLTSSFKSYLSGEISKEVPNQNDKVPNQNDKTVSSKRLDSQIKMIRQTNQNDKTHISNDISNDNNYDISNDTNIEEIQKLEIYVGELRAILQKYYNSTSSRFNNKTAKHKLKTALKKYSYEIIKNGYENYLIANLNKGVADIKYIKKFETFMNQEEFLEYQVLEDIKSKNNNDLSINEKIDMYKDA